MSVHFKLYCPNHEVDGPGLRTSAGGSVALTSQTYQFYETGDLDWEMTKEIGNVEWWTFLREHEFCGGVEVRRVG